MPHNKPTFAQPLRPPYTFSFDCIPRAVTSAIIIDVMVAAAHRRASRYATCNSLELDLCLHRRLPRGRIRTRKQVSRAAVEITSLSGAPPARAAFDPT
ncbi:hypothetical protein EVAR_14780_1 [Eumeta japonica]|uniref:Uncharacterized protein n=1 Tax=Eumeta variegata TaxID=151549 RepID=A0A4C1TWJ1_EUMVA|nr:hypothetical protein EVAR_14780_1 [Eumeta japonica]